MIKAIGFDLDDTLLLSEEEKTKIFCSLLCKDIKNGQSEKKVHEFYIKLKGTGKTTEQKIKLFYEKFSNKMIEDKKARKIADEFSKNYIKAMKTCPLMLCSSLIVELKKKGYILFVVSLVKTKEAKEILKHCGMLKYFHHILGAPKSKLANFKHIIKKYKLKPEQVVYIGDSKGDVVSAETAKMHFIGISRKKYQADKLKKLGADKVKKDLCSIIPELLRTNSIKAVHKK